MQSSAKRPTFGGGGEGGGYEKLKKDFILRFLYRM